MIGKASRLAPIAEHAGKVEDNAARRLATCAKALQTKRQEVEQLRSYLAEYRQRAELEQHFADSVRWRNTRAFLARLSDAVAAHEAELLKATEHYRLEAERWRDSHRRAKSLDQVIERAQREALEETLKRDQAELDELMLRKQLGRH